MGYSGRQRYSQAFFPSIVKATRNRAISANRSILIELVMGNTFTYCQLSVIILYYGILVV